MSTAPPLRACLVSAGAAALAAALAAAVCLASVACCFLQQDLVWDVEEEGVLRAEMTFDRDYHYSHVDAPWWV
ncbi:hypothetical protein [Nocardioides ochotonae]|uniref:hypothetical protein n=1 Tax=Nocardioides ochotonae TaxID=2685869 RepID=UPI001407470B|nr:hypothetical protein [Nocardioides ochotonae]